MTSSPPHDAGRTIPPALPPAPTRPDAGATAHPGGTSAVPRVALVGIHGHGRSHLRNIWHLQHAGALELVCLVDLTPLPDPTTLELDHPPDGIEQVLWTTDLPDALDRTRPDVVVICTPIHTHAELTVQALEAGADVLLEKPPTASLDELAEVLAAEERTGHVVQVGFQTFGSTALPTVHQVIADGVIGEVTGIGGVGTWVRTLDYWRRSRWTGRRTLDGQAVVDGVTTNPLAHAVATALHLAGARETDDVLEVRLDQYRANAVEVDDTTAVQVRTRDGITVSLGLTLCAATHTQPLITVQGTRGTAQLDYYADAVTVTTPDGSTTHRGARTTLLEDLLAHRRDGSALLSPLRGTGAFMRVLDAVRAAPDPTPIPPELITTVTDGAGTHLVVEEVAAWCARVAAEHATFAELGAPWASRPTPTLRATGDPG